MAWPTIFNNLAGGNQALSLFDTMFNQVGQMVEVPSTVTGSNALTLSPIGNAPLWPSYQEFCAARFRAVATSTGVVTAQFGALASLNVYRADGVTQAGSGDILNGQEYVLRYSAALNGGAGGLFLEAPAINSISGIAFGGVQIFNTAGTYTYTPTANVTFIRIWCVGGGGAGGGTPATTSTQYAGGGGGASGATAMKFMSAPLSPLTVIVGAGGTPVSGGNGGSGGTSQAGSVSAGGGGGGGFALIGSNSTSPVSGALGGNGASGGDINLAGNAGTNGLVVNLAVSQQFAIGGGGGPGFLGMGSGAPSILGNSSSSLQGNGGTTYGAGGGGAAAGTSSPAQLGGAGSVGIVIIEQYIGH